MILIDEWKIKSSPIDIPRSISSGYAKIASKTHEYWVRIHDRSHEILEGHVDYTPPNSAEYGKGSRFLFHLENVLSFKHQHVPSCKKLSLT
jgi:hypothetical protein